MEEDHAAKPRPEKAVVGNVDPGIRTVLAPAKTSPNGRIEAMLLAASHPPILEAGSSWSHDEISQTVDHLVMTICEMTDFSDDVVPID